MLKLGDNQQIQLKREKSPYNREMKKIVIEMVRNKAGLKKSKLVCEF